MKWIPVDKKLPDKEGKYLVVLRVGDEAVRKFITISHFHQERYNPKFLVGEWQEVLYWMPLPEIP